MALLEQIRTHGLRDWVVISQELSALVEERTRNQCRQRFQFIYKSFKKNPFGVKQYSGFSKPKKSFGSHLFGKTGKSFGYKTPG